ncbi:MAG: 4-hydroxy-3-methylbut-2-enyl diphosphate reductase [Candidatus Omnitrophica bacterium]|nr:4-hydroxy-3-methylbut-2-enyl diphosphate reductase [Candidatus Omnitrophota bacterium]MBU4488463.1 4-hydroxy-3-methylbut-2-enyl diphosphate reductase [Candidatus Omnitrophota bacterium]MCG2705346.1 4-hydroxy-3-methylbut-2-enyl diphosphate reductase [Candidatus Omnitrophota bacterium]
MQKIRRNPPKLNAKPVLRSQARKQFGEGGAIQRRRICVSNFSDFCFGVKRAIAIAEGTLKNGRKPVYSLGAIIHNKEVVRRLAEKGLEVLKASPKTIKGGSLVICSHGIHPDRLKEAGSRIKIIDATCPFVKNAQKIAEKLFREGYKVIIIGDKGHPEVRSLKKFTGNKAVIISNIEEASNFKSKAGKIGIIAQTTQASGDFGLIVAEILRKAFKEARVFNTICHDADMRQKSTKAMARHNDLVIVIGGKDSANTKRLYRICRKVGAIAYHIERETELRKSWFKGINSVGVVSGASTPKWIVDEVVEKLRQF